MACVGFSIFFVKIVATKHATCSPVRTRGVTNSGFGWTVSVAVANRLQESMSTREITQEVARMVHARIRLFVVAENEEEV